MKIIRLKNLKKPIKKYEKYCDYHLEKNKNQKLKTSDIEEYRKKYYAEHRNKAKKHNKEYYINNKEYWKDRYKSGKSNYVYMFTKPFTEDAKIGDIYYIGSCSNVKNRLIGEVNNSVAPYLFDEDKIGDKEWDYYFVDFGENISRIECYFIEHLLIDRLIPKFNNYGRDIMKYKITNKRKDELIELVKNSYWTTLEIIDNEEVNNKYKNLKTIL